MSETRLFGIRHHGPGCARALRDELGSFDPEIVLIEGPPEAESLLGWVGDPELVPPVALLAYDVADPARAIFGPFTEFSPEWVAMRWATQHDRPVRLIDMPAAHTLAPKQENLFEKSDSEPESKDPLAFVAAACGEEDGERWWDRQIEERRDAEGVFEAISEWITFAREELGEPTDPRELQREAFMREGVRSAEKQGCVRIAVVVGAMHLPAIERRKAIKSKDDRALIAGLPKTKVAVCWVPWSYARIAAASGYGAGVISPAYYEHLWRANRARAAAEWLLNAAHLLRKNDLSASPAGVIEALRLAEALANIRGFGHPGLRELQESVASVLAEGNSAPMHLIERELIIGERTGEVSTRMPGLPLQQDFSAQIKALKLKLSDEPKTLELDLREPLDLSRSHFLHRLRILGLDWGEVKSLKRKKGTFHEHWELSWSPEHALHLVTASRLGNTVEIAAIRFVLEWVDQPQSLRVVTDALSDILLADLGPALERVLQQLQVAASAATDVSQILDGIPGVARGLRYGNVRSQDESALRRVLDGLASRAAIQLESALVNLDDEAADLFAERLTEVHPLVLQSADPAAQQLWIESLLRLSASDLTHGLITGRLTCLLQDSNHLTQAESDSRWQRVLTPGVPHRYAAAWLEGALGDSGIMLIHNRERLEHLDRYVQSLEGELFHETLPLLRRTFSRFSKPERRQLADLIAQPGGRQVEPVVPLDPHRVAMIDRALKALLEL